MIEKYTIKKISDLTNLELSEKLIYSLHHDFELYYPQEDLIQEAALRLRDIGLRDAENMKQIIKNLIKD